MRRGPGNRIHVLCRALSVALLLLAGSAAASDFHAGLQLQLLRQAGTLLADFRPPAAETYQLPVQGRLTSTFGWRNVSVGGNRNHGGIDLAAPSGTPVRASLSGTVSFSGWSGAYGYVIYLDHDPQVQTRYAHLSGFAVETGDRVQQGDVIGYVGSTGASTGPHLHFEIRLAGVAVDPLPRLPDGQNAQTGAIGGR